MDFTVPAPGGVGPGAPAAIAARGADPAISIPAGNHLFRRINALVLAPVAGALLPVPTTLPQSLMEFVLGPTISHDGVVAIADLPALVNKCTPTKFDAALTQLEAEPAGVGLDPTSVYDDLEHAAAAVKAAMQRVRARAGPVNPAYIGVAADFYPLEPVNLAAATQFVALCVGPTALTLGQLSVSNFLEHYGFFNFLTLGNSQSASRDLPNTPSRRVVAQLSQFASAANFFGPLPAGTRSSSRELAPSLLT